MNDSFKNEYFSIEGWMKQSFMNYKEKIKGIRVEDGGTTRNQRIENSILIFKVKRDELYSAKELASEMNGTLNNQKENRELLHNFKDISNILNLKQEEIKKEEAFNDVSKIVNDRDKKEVKNAPRKQKHKKLRLLAVIMAGGTLLAGTGKAINEIRDYKEEIAKESVKVLKEEIGAEKIMNHTTILGSDSALAYYEVTTPKGVYEYKERLSSGGFFVMKNDFDDETLEALNTVFNAQDGSIFYTIKADKLIKDIKNGDVELNKLDDTKNVEIDDEER